MPPHPVSFGVITPGAATTVKVDQWKASNGPIKIRHSDAETFSYQGCTMTMAEWASQLGVPEARLRWRKRQGWPIARVLEAPAAPTNGQAPPIYRYWFAWRGIFGMPWRTSFDKFAADMGSMPASGHTVGRLAIHGPYCDDQGSKLCRWMTQTEVNRNNRAGIVLTRKGVTLGLGSWAEDTDIPYRELVRRYRKGYATDEILSESLTLTFLIEGKLIEIGCRGHWTLRKVRNLALRKSGRMDCDNWDPSVEGLTIYDSNMDQGVENLKLKIDTLIELTPIVPYKTVSLTTGEETVTDSKFVIFEPPPEAKPTVYFGETPQGKPFKFAPFTKPEPQLFSTYLGLPVQGSTEGMLDPGAGLEEWSLKGGEIAPDAATTVKAKKATLVAQWNAEALKSEALTAKLLAEIKETKQTEPPYMSTEKFQAALKKAVDGGDAIEAIALEEDLKTLELLNDNSKWKTDAADPCEDLHLAAKCEDCEKPATRFDVDGVPFCTEHHEALPPALSPVQSHVGIVSTDDQGVVTWSDGFGLNPKSVGVIEVDPWTGNKKIIWDEPELLDVSQIVVPKPTD